MATEAPPTAPANRPNARPSPETTVIKALNLSPSLTNSGPNLPSKGANLVALFPNIVKATMPACRARLLPAYRMF